MRSFETIAPWMQALTGWLGEGSLLNPQLHLDITIQNLYSVIQPREKYFHEWSGKTQLEYVKNTNSSNFPC